MDRRWLLLSLVALMGCAGPSSLRAGVGASLAKKSAESPLFREATSSKTIEPRNRPLTFDLIPELHQ